jgi:hypothetical protein
MSQKQRPWLDAHQLARDPGFRPGPSKTTEPGVELSAGPGQQGPAESGLGVMCKGCGGDQVIPIPVWGLTAESDHDPDVLVVPVALVCLECGAQSIYQARWRPGEEAADGE